ncbi:hypothetical protein ACHAXT_012004, partial [Thalassiosira profunda]
PYDWYLRLHARIPLGYLSYRWQRQRIPYEEPNHSPDPDAEAHRQADSPAHGLSAVRSVVHAVL